MFVCGSIYLVFICGVSFSSCDFRFGAFRVFWGTLVRSIVCSKDLSDMLVYLPFAFSLWLVYVDFEWLL